MLGFFFFFGIPPVSVSVQRVSALFLPSKRAFCLSTKQGNNLAMDLLLAGHNMKFHDIPYSLLKTLLTIFICFHFQKRNHFRTGKFNFEI
jgi:hypothetical protein